MTRDRAKALLPIITAFANGQTVQLNHGRDSWHDANSPDFSDSPENYRIKPAPQYRPWTRDEVPLGKEVRNASGARVLLTHASDSSVGGASYSEMLTSWTMADGSPCGVEVKS